MKQLFVPADFTVPEKLQNDKFTLRMLTIHDVDKDYEAVMSSIDHLKGVFGERSTWPSTDLTKEQDLIDLGWHQKEFQRRTSFAYTVMSPNEAMCLGCVYLFPSDTEDIQVDIYMWVRESELQNGLDTLLFTTVKQWIAVSWPFQTVSYPGREE